jgi:hypothetical protein
MVGGYKGSLKEQKDRLILQGTSPGWARRRMREETIRSYSFSAECALPYKCNPYLLHYGKAYGRYIPSSSPSVELHDATRSAACQGYKKKAACVLHDPHR